MDPGALTTDSKGTYTLTNQGSVAESAGKYNGASNTGTPNSTNKCLYRTASVPSLGGGAFSIAGWVKFNSTASSSAVANFCDNASKGVFTRFQYNTGALYFYRTKSGVAQQGPTYAWTPTVGVWYHIAMTYDSTNIRGYLDGSLVGGPTAASGVGTVDETSGIGIGIDGQAFSALTTDDTIQACDVSFWSRELTAAELLKLYTSGLKTFDGLAKASVKTIDGLAIASVKTINGLYIA